MRKKESKEELIELFFNFYANKTDPQILPYYLHRAFALPIMGGSLVLFNGQYLSISLGLGLQILFKPHPQSVIECYYLEKKEHYSYNFYHFKEPEPTDKGQWQYALWRLLEGWQKHYKPLKGLLVLISSPLPYSDALGTPQALQLAFFQLLQIYLQENPFWLEKPRRNEQLEAIHFIQNTLLSPNHRIIHQLSLLHSMVLLQDHQIEILYTNQKTLEPRFIHWKIQQKSLWLLTFDGLDDLLHASYTRRLAELDQTLELFASLDVLGSDRPLLTHTLLEQYADAIPDSLRGRLDYLIFENIRVFELVLALEFADAEEVVRIFNQSQKSFLYDYGFENPQIQQLIDYMQRFPVVKSLRLASRLSGLFILLMEDDAIALEDFFHQLTLSYGPEQKIRLCHYHKISL